MSSGVRLMDALSPRDRSKTVLNGKREDVLIVSQGRALELQNGEDGEAQAPTRIELVKLGNIVRVVWWDRWQEKSVKARVEFSREYVEQMVANTIAVRNGNPLPWYVDHVRWGPAYGWFRPEDLEVTDMALFANNVQWIGGTAGDITARRFLYCSIGWHDDYRDYNTDKLIGPLLIESSLTNNPYLVGQRGLAASGGDLLIAAAVPVDAAAQDEEAEMLEKLKKLLGLKAEATEEEVGLEAELAAEARLELAEVDKALESVEGADRAAKLAAALAAVATVATTTVAKLAGGAADTEKETTDPESGTVAGMGADAAEVLVEAAVAAGKVPPKGEAREKLAAALATLSVADAKEVLGLVGAGVPKGGDLKGKVAADAEGAAPGLRETMRQNLGLSREALEKFAPDKVQDN